MKMKMHFKVWERKMKRLINSMMIHLEQVQLVSDIFVLCHLDLLIFSNALIYKCFVKIGVISFTDLAEYSILDPRIVQSSLKVSTLLVWTSFCRTCKTRYSLSPIPLLYDLYRLILLSNSKWTFYKGLK